MNRQPPPLPCHPPRRRRPRGRVRQAGFTLLETLIALGIGLFLLGGIVLVMGITRQNFNAQNGLSQLQDDQRIAVSMLVMVVEHAGFFPNPQVRTVADAFPVVAPFSPGQSVYGITGTGGASDTLTLRYRQGVPNGPGSDFMLDCNGASNPGPDIMSTSTFSRNASGELTCSVNGATAQPLVAGISAFRVLYGVDSNNDRSVDQYLPASQITADLWLRVGSVRVQLDFTNPLDSSKPVSVVRVINLMNQS